uniref:Uncharacterized protein n=1 Tax=Lotus japonicus TaxID=34305 RepID=I3SXK7_LOTJA|nr:unknown [Lotus japonicus]
MKLIGVDTEALKQHFGKKIMELDEEKRKVQHERDRLLHEVENLSANSNGLAHKNQDFRAKFDKQNQVQAALEDELAFLKQADQFSDGQSILTGKSRYSRLLSMSPDVKAARIASLENMLSMSSVALKAMTTQLTEAEDRERTLSNRGRWFCCWFCPCFQASQEQETAQDQDEFGGHSRGNIAALW